MTIAQAGSIQDPSITYQEALEQVLMSIKINRPVFLWGPPGVGKSALGSQIARDLKLKYLDIRMSLLNPVDLRGLPMVDASQGQAVWLPPDFLPKSDDNSGYLINFDELNLATPVVQGAAYQLILDRACGNHKLPENCYIIACGNREQDRAVTFDMPAPLRNRFFHLEMRADLGDWAQWALENNINPKVLSFLRRHTSRLFEFDPKVHKRGFPTPRSWHYVSDILNETDHPEKYASLIEGGVGAGACLELLAHIKLAEQLPDIEQIIYSGANPDVPSDPSVLFALTTSFSSHVYSRITKVAQSEPEKAVDYLVNIFKYAKRLTVDFSAHMMMDVARSPLIKGNREFVSKLCRREEARDFLVTLQNVLG